MNRIALPLAAVLMGGFALPAFAQGTAPARPVPGTATGATPGNSAPGATSNAPMPGVSPSTGVTPGTDVVNRNTGTAAASGDRNQAVATTGANAPQPARGANSFTESEARGRIERAGFSSVTALQKDGGGVWRGTATKDGQSTQVWLDYKGNVGQGGATASTVAAPATGTTTTAPATRNLDGTTGNQPGTAAGRAMDRTLGTNATGTNPGRSNATTPR